MPRQVVDVQNHLMPTLIALDVERAHAVGPHVLQRHRLDRIIEAGTGHQNLNVSEVTLNCPCLRLNDGTMTASRKGIDMCDLAYVNLLREKVRQREAEERRLNAFGPTPSTRFVPWIMPDQSPQKEPDFACSTGGSPTVAPATLAAS